jgi:hypothetical protein
MTHKVESPIPLFGNSISSVGGFLMKHIICILILFPVVVFAQGQPEMPPNMSQRDMEQMQRNM